MAYQDDPGDEADQWPDPPRLLPGEPGRKDDAVKAAHETWAAILAGLADEAARQEAHRLALLEKSLGMKL